MTVTYRCHSCYEEEKRQNAQDNDDDDDDDDDTNIYLQLANKLTNQYPCSWYLVVTVYKTYYRVSVVSVYSNCRSELSE